ncbi:MAG: hypothetical protein JW925_13025 [Syntrophaceae bacterium]|nr:hypothetical protein [Syntrophaceae bacterium]
MSDNPNNRLEELFKAARAVRYETVYIEEGFEERFLCQLRSNKQNEAPLSLWSWRLAPVMTAMLLILLVLNAVIEPQRSSNILSLISNGHEQAQVKKYLTGE